MYTIHVEGQSLSHDPITVEAMQARLEGPLLSFEWMAYSYVH